MEMVRRHRMVWHGIGQHKESFHKRIFEDMMAVEKDRNGRKIFGLVDIEGKGLAVGVDTDTAGPPKLASQHY